MVSPQTCLLPTPSFSPTKWGLHFVNACPAIDDLAALGPLAHGVLRQLHAEDALQASLMRGI